MSAAKKTGNIFVWIILLLLIIGLGGFGISNFGGSIQSIGEVGDTEIPVNAYARELDQELRAAEAQTGTRLTLAQAQAFGIVDRARTRVITAAALDNELSRLGLSVGDEQVRRQVLSYGQFRASDGSFDREAYRFTLEQNGLTEAEFEEQIRAETARTLLQGAVLSGIRPPDTYGRTLFEFIAARRSYAFVQLGADDLETPVGTPDAAALQAHYEENEAAFTAPEQKAITYVWLTPEMVLPGVEIDEESLRAAYDQRISEYQRPERRLVERLVYPSAEEAEAARARLDAGEAGFEELVAERGLDLSDIDFGDVTEDDLEDGGEEVFALEEPGVVGPIETDLGPALFRMNGILAAVDTSFDEARDALQEELAQDRARRMVSDQITDIDDRLAAGATLEELAQETGMELGQIAYTDGADSGIAGYESFRQAADAVAAGDFPEVAELEDGGIFALRLDEVIAPRLKPLDEVRAEAIAGWQAAETLRRLTAQAEALKARLDAGEDISALGYETEGAEAVTRGGVAPAEITDTVFALGKGESAVVENGGGVILVQVSETLPPDPEDADAGQMKQSLDAQSVQSISQDMFLYFTRSLLNSAGLRLDEAAINAVHAQFP